MQKSQRMIPQIARSSLWPKNILYVDRGVIVVNKPSGLICQGSKESAVHNIRENGFNELLKELKDILKMDNLPYPVHRLDKYTTGCLVFARTANIAREISRQFHDGTVEKSYLALVRGGAESFPAAFGEIRAPLKFVDGRASLGVPNHDKYAETHWEVVASSSASPLSLVHLKLKTGLKHQLRVHMAKCLKTPILGDSLHSQSKVADAISNINSIPENRIFLHASHVSFIRYRPSGPHKRFRIGIRAPLPDDFLRICSNAGIKVDLNAREGGLFLDGVQVEENLVTGGV